MKIINKTKKTIISNNAIFAKSLIQKTLGLLAYKTPQILYFKTHFGIHTYFLKYPIDIIILDNQKKVVKIKRNLKPNNIFLWNPKYKNVLEIPSNISKKIKISLEDKLEFIDLKV